MRKSGWKTVCVSRHDNTLISLEEANQFGKKLINQDALLGVLLGFEGEDVLLHLDADAPLHIDAGNESLQQGQVVEVVDASRHITQSMNEVDQLVLLEGQLLVGHAM